MPRADGAAAFEQEDLPIEWQSRERMRDANSAISGILIAVGSSLLLWAGLAQAARWAAHAIL
jgi:hypothetical protein